MASRIKVTLEHHRNRRYHVISHGPGRRPAISYGNFNLRFRDPQRGGKRVRVALAVNSVTDALESRRSKEMELNATPVAERKPVLKTISDKHLTEIKAGRKKKTYQAYDVALRYFLEAIGNKPLHMITRHDMLDFRVYLREEKGQAPRSEWNKFSNVMGFLKRHGIKGTDLGITTHDWPQYTEEEPEIYEHEELRRFFDACSEQERLIFEIFLMTGMREQEVVYATNRSVSVTNCTVSVRHNPSHGWTPKMYKERTIPVPPSLILKLKARDVTDGLLFPTSNGQPQHHFLQMAKAIARRAGLPEDTVWLHKFRATFATRCLWGGVDLRTVQMWMGHTDLASTMRYLKPQRGAAVQEKIEAIWNAA